MAKFRNAWCEEIQSEMSPEDVADFWVQKDKKPELMCPDEACRLEKPGTRLVPVCCDPRQSGCSQTPHFRTNPRHIHGHGCQYELMGQHTDYILRHKDEFIDEFPDANLLRKIKNIDTELLPDEYMEKFIPHEFLEAVTHKAQEYRKKGSSEERAFRRARCAVPQKTSRLGLVVDMALRLDAAGGDSLREEIPLSLPNRQNANYLNAFLMLTSLKEHYKTPYILCGDATIHELPYGYIIKYENILNYYVPNLKVPACTLINPEDYHAAFLEEVKSYAASGEVCSVYSFSTHDLKESTCPILEAKRCVVIEPRFRDAVVIRNRCLKRAQNNTR